jgi:hypothetical protein
MTAAEARWWRPLSMPIQKNFLAKFDLTTDDVFKNYGNAATVLSSGDALSAKLAAFAGADKSLKKHILREDNGIAMLLSLQLWGFRQFMSWSWIAVVMFPRSLNSLIFLRLGKSSQVIRGWPMQYAMRIAHCLCWRQL